MKTIAVSIDEETLEALDRLTATAGGARNRPNRSEIVRAALHQYLVRRHRQQQEQRERKILSKHKKRLSRQAAALVAEQADL